MNRSMSLQNGAISGGEAAPAGLTGVVRTKLREALKARELTQDAFARRHDLSTSWLNKFLRGEIDNPRVNSLDRLEKAIALELQS